MIADLIVDAQRDGAPLPPSDALVEAMAATGVHIRSGRLAYVLDGELDSLLDATRAAVVRLRSEGADRALVELRLLVEQEQAEPEAPAPGYRSIGEHAD